MNRNLIKYDSENWGLSLLKACVVFAIWMLFFGMSVMGDVALAQNQSSNKNLETITFKSIAFDESGKLFLYTEHHTLTKRDSKVIRTVTTYKNKNGKSLGSFKSNYSSHSFAPDTVLKDVVANRVTRTQLKGKNLILSNGQNKKAVNIPTQKPLVIGQGLHYFVLEHFSKLQKGKTIDFVLGVPDRQAIYEFRVFKLKDLPKGKVRLRIEIDSWVKRRLVDPIDVDYTRDGKLTRYKGISNLSDESGKRPTVIIQY